MTNNKAHKEISSNYREDLLNKVNLALIPLTGIGGTAMLLSSKSDLWPPLFMLICVLLFSTSYLLNKKSLFTAAKYITVYTCVFLPLANLLVKPILDYTVFETLIWLLLPSLLASIFFSLWETILLISFACASPLIIAIFIIEINYRDIYQVILGFYFPISIVILVISNTINKLIKQTEKQAKSIQNSLDEKDILLQEIHHRVKNNLQVITGLLSLQANYLDSEKSKDLYKQSQHRIQSMAMIHEILYQSDNLAEINYEDYLNMLTSYLNTSMNGSEKNVKINTSVKSIFLNIDTAVPLGLLTTEIITNSFKYAFKDNSADNIIDIEIQKTDAINYTLLIGDNGKGVSSKIDYKTSNTLGFKLINNLTRQLKGTLTKQDKAGTNYKINFQEIYNSN